MRGDTLPQKPWYFPTIVALLSHDVPRLTNISSGAFARDIDTIERRLSAEGEGFLTKTLPSFGKSIDLALQGHVPLTTNLFKKQGRSALPAFLSALLRRVFRSDGWIRDNPCIVCIRLLRQICFWCKKLEKGYTDESLRRALQDFTEIDRGLPADRRDLGAAEPLLAVARLVVWRIFRNIGDLSHYTPKHGPGAVAYVGEDALCKRLGAGLHKFRALESYFRPIPWFFSMKDAQYGMGTILDRVETEYGLSRLEFVFKDSSGPRSINLEPTEYMEVQQAMKQWLYDHVQFLSYAAGHINFTDQDINRELTKLWDIFDTLDMSKASDRNALVLVMDLFSLVPKVLTPLLACRTPGTVLPNGEVMFYRKFAPMGSAVCFPVQAVVYYALAVAALHLSGMPIELARRKVYVYGDDLVVPHGYFHVLNEAFESVGLKFNTDKCCTHGRFRESCGLDSYDGQPVTPVRLRCGYPKNTAELLRLVEHANALHLAGYLAASDSFRNAAMKVEVKLSGKIKISLAKMKIPFSHRTDLPFATWLSQAEAETVRYKTRDGITRAKGWVAEVRTRPVPEICETALYRESLTRVGPVGVCRKTSSDPNKVERVMPLRYPDIARARSFAVLRTVTREAA